jgi:hypothetical protein
MQDKVADQSTSAHNGVVREYDTAHATDGCQDGRMETGQEWHTALPGKPSDPVPAKLLISLLPVRHAA